MDIYQQICEELGIVDLAFDENNLFICELNCTESGNEYSRQLSIYRDEIEQNLCFALSGQNELPTLIAGDFLTLLCEQALQPLNSGLGIGIFPGSRILTVYKKYLWPDIIKVALTNSYQN